MSDHERATAAINAVFAPLFGKKKKPRRPTLVVLREGYRWNIKRSSTYGYYMEVSMVGKSGYWPTMKSLRQHCAENGWEIVSSKPKPATP